MDGERSVPDLAQAPEVILDSVRSAQLEAVWARDDGSPSVWKVCRGGSTVAFLKVDVDLAGEADRLRWLKDRLPVPEVLEIASGADARDWLLTAALPGVMACDPIGEDPGRVIEVLGETLQKIHSLPVSTCPFGSPAESGLADSRRRLAAGETWRCWHPFRKDWVSAADLLEELELDSPEAEAATVIHGDYCLPNVLMRDGQLTGILDAGHLGGGDPGFDIVSADGSGRRNLGEAWDLDRFLAAYGSRPDPNRLRWLTMLRALLWS
jgi:aminoglycoside phosphotransferase